MLVQHPSGAPEFTPVFSGVRVAQSLVLCVCFLDRCLSFCSFFFFFVLFVLLRFTDSDYLPLVSSNSSCTVCILVIRHAPVRPMFI